MITLPTRTACIAKAESGEDLTPLESFIRDYDVLPDYWAEPWRAALVAALEQAQGAMA